MSASRCEKMRKQSKFQKRSSAEMASDVDNTIPYVKYYLLTSSTFNQFRLFSVKIYNTDKT